MEWYQKAAQQGHVGAKDALKMFADREQMDVYKVQQDRLAKLIQQQREHIAKYAAASVDQLYKTANRRDSEAQMNLGRRYLEGNGVAQDEKMGVKYLFKAAIQGNPRAFFVLQKAAMPGIFTSGSAEAAFALGKMYASGQGVPVSDAGALMWFRRAAEQDYPGAAELVKLHDAKLLAALHSAADSGDPTASFILAKRYLAPDNGTEYGVKEAIPLLIRAAGLGNAEALTLLEAQASSGWFSYGDANAAFALGEIFSKGIGVQADLAKASSWYDVAAQQGIVAAKARLEELQQQQVSKLP
jgi:TPR repeat protein